MTEPIKRGEGYANLTDDSSFSGTLELYPNWVHITNQKGEYSVPRRRIDFLNFKEVK